MNEIRQSVQDALETIEYYDEEFYKYIRVKALTDGELKHKLETIKMNEFHLVLDAVRYQYGRDDLKTFVENTIEIMAEGFYAVYKNVKEYGEEMMRLFHGDGMVDELEHYLDFEAFGFDMMDGRCVYDCYGYVVELTEV